MTDQNTQPPAGQPPAAQPPAGQPPQPQNIDLGALMTQLNEAKQQAITYQQQVTQLQSQLATLTTERDTAVANLTNTTAQWQQAQAQFGTLQTQLGELQQLRTTLDQQVAQLSGERSNLQTTNNQYARQLAMINHIGQQPDLLSQAAGLLPLLPTLQIPETAEDQLKTLRLWAGTLAAARSSGVNDFRQGATNPAQGAAPVTPPATGQQPIFTLPGQQPPPGGQPLTPGQIAQQMAGVAGFDDAKYEALAQQLITAQNGSQRTEN